jgi:hypothetical protein
MLRRCLDFSRCVAVVCFVAFSCVIDARIARCLGGFVLSLFSGAWLCRRKSSGIFSVRTAFARQTQRTTTGNLSAPLFLLNFNVEGYVLDFNGAILCVFRPEKRISRENAFHMFAFNCWARNEKPEIPGSRRDPRSTASRDFRIGESCGRRRTSWIATSNGSARSSRSLAPWHLRPFCAQALGRTCD